jgi:hypothetical protein
MADDREAPVVPERATQATTRTTTVPLNEFVLRPELYCHRDEDELRDRNRLRPLMDSLTVEGLQTPVEFFRDADGRPVVDKGHRRISSMRQLARENTPRFTETMPVEAVEVLNATQADLICRSVSDNANRRDYTLAERIRAAGALHKGGVEANRAAFALNYSTKQYLRDLRIAQHPWMLAYVEKEDIGHTAAGELLEAGEKAGRVEALKEHLDAWVAAKPKEVEASGKEKKLKGFLTKALSDHWIGQLRDKKPLDNKVAPPKALQASIEADANLITLEGKVDLLKAPLKALEEAELTFYAMQKVVREYRKARQAVEGARGPQDIARMEAEELEQLARQLTDLQEQVGSGSSDTGAEDANDAREGR